MMLALTSSNWAPTPPAMIGVVGAVTMAVLASFGVEPARGLALGTVFNVRTGQSPRADWRCRSGATPVAPRRDC